MRTVAIGSPNIFKKTKNCHLSLILQTHLDAGCLYSATHLFNLGNDTVEATYLDRVIRDVARKIDGDHGLEARFALLLSLARRVRARGRGQRGPKVYSLHAPEVECIGKGNAHKAYEFGVKVSVATPLKHSKGGQFVAHVQAENGNDGALPKAAMGRGPAAAWEEGLAPRPLGRAGVCRGLVNLTF
jgi:hypothetical protein